MEVVDRAERLTLLGKDKAGRPISLSSGFLKRYGLLWPERSPATFRFNRAFLGAHFPAEESAVLTELSARIPALDHWLGISGLIIDDLESRRELAIRFSQPEDLKFEIEPGLQLVFGFGWQGPTLRRPQLEASIRQEVWLILKASPARSFGDLETTFNRLLNLFSLLVGEALGYESLSAEVPRRSRKSQEKNWPTRVDIAFAPVAPEAVGKIVEEQDMLLRFKDIRVAHPGLFQRWLEKYKVCHPAFDLYFSVQRRDTAYQEQRFLSGVQSLETLHRLSSQSSIPKEHQNRVERIRERCSEDWGWLESKLRYSHEPSLSKRLKDLLRPFGDLFGSRAERSRFAQRVADTRNYLTHYDPGQKIKAVKPSRLTPYIFRLKVLFVLHCLLELGFTPDEARQSIEKNDQLRQMVRFGKV